MPGVIDEDMDHSQGKSEVPTGAPLQIMTQFLRAVSESRMVDALALAQTILTFEPSNTMITDYQATLAQYINNEREMVAESEESDGDEHSVGESSSQTEEDDSGEATCSEDESTEAPSDEETFGRKDAKLVPAESKDDGKASCSNEKKGQSRIPRSQDEYEERRLGAMLRDLRQARVIGNQELMSRWDEGKFAASRREVESVLHRFLPGKKSQAAQKREECNENPLPLSAPATPPPPKVSSDQQV